jgi:predicted RNase H-like nuclease
MRELLDHHHDANLILVDIPIGLPSKGTPSRPCDTAARLLLGRRRSSVFSAPSRFASRALDIADARQRNIAELGKSLSAQAHAICLKIAEVDQLLLTDHSLRNRVREVHPEVCFWALNGRAPLQHAKKERAGREERIGLLSRYEPGTSVLLDQVRRAHRRAEVQDDDAPDALVAYVTASRGMSLGHLQSVCSTPSFDAEQLPMEMLYAV